MTKKPAPPATEAPLDVVAAIPLPSGGGAYVFDGSALRAVPVEEDPHLAAPAPDLPANPETV